MKTSYTGKTIFVPRHCLAEVEKLIAKRRRQHLIESLSKITSEKATKNEEFVSKIASENDAQNSELGIKTSERPVRTPEKQRADFKANLVRNLSISVSTVRTRNKFP